jgi:DHA1 family multidrug resistance protein-like MFS transporter
MIDLIRDSTVGQIINTLSAGRLLPYADQRPDYVVPARYNLPGTSATSTICGNQTPNPRQSESGDVHPSSILPSALDSALRNSLGSTRTLVKEVGPNGAENENKSNPQAVVEGDVEDLEKGKTQLETKVEQVTESEKDPYLVEWDGPNDPDNPRYAFFRWRLLKIFVECCFRRNWSLLKRSFVAFSISLLTFSGKAFCPFLVDIADMVWLFLSLHRLSYLHK